MFNIGIKVRNKKKKKPSPYFKLNQSTKSNIDDMWSSIYTLVQFIEVYIKVDLIVWSDHSTSLKALLLFSFQKVRNKHK